MKTKTTKIYLALLVYTFLIGYLTAPLDPHAAEMIQNVWVFTAAYVATAASIEPIRAHFQKHLKS